MAFIVGVITGACAMYLCVKIGLSTGEQGEFKYCLNCPYKVPNLENESEGDVIESVSDSIRRNPTGSNTDTLI